MKIYVFKLSRWFTLGALAFFLCLFCFVGYKLVIQQVVSPTLAPTNPIFQGSEDKKAMALTCNVAWGNEHLAPMLEIFDRYDVTVTFFLEGRWAENFPDLAKQLAEKHEVGNHGYGHKHHNALSLENNREEIRKGQEAIQTATGVTTTLFAPPYGEWSEKVVTAASELNHLTIMWSIDTIDWQRPAPSTIHKRVTEKAHNGGIVLMHPVEQTVEALPGIIEYLQGEGYELVTISQLLQ